MREIVFRGKGRDGEGWVYGDLVQSRFNGEFIECKKGHKQRLVQVKTETVGQYTGLLDENRARIFEGDIVNFVIFDFNGRDTHYTGVVKFAQGCYQIWKTVESEYYGSDGAFVLGWIDCDEIEVVGNVFENAELLEVE